MHSLCIEINNMKLCLIWQGQNLVGMVHFYLPMNALLLFGLIQRLHKETTISLDLLTIYPSRYMDNFFSHKRSFGRKEIYMAEILPAWGILVYLSSVGYVTIQGASQNLKAPSTTTPSLKIGTSSCGAHMLHNSTVPSADASIKQIQVAVKSTLKDEVSSRSEPSGNPTDQRTLKVRIKVGCDNSERKNAAIYSGLGLDDSPSSSPGDSPVDSRGTSPISQETTDRSPTSIIQVTVCLAFYE